MAVTFHLVVPGIPRGKERPRFRRGQRRPFTPKQTRENEADIGWVARQAMRVLPPLAGAFRVDIKAVMPVPASWSAKRRESALSGLILPTNKPDIDNILKGVLDGLNKIIWTDDAQVTDARVQKCYGSVPRLEIFVRMIELQEPT